MKAIRIIKTVLLIIISGVLLLSFCIALGLILVFLSRFLYAANYENWHIREMSGLSKTEVMLNFDALMKWCSPFYTKPLAFPTLPMSEGGAQHFADCKVLFNRFLLGGAISAVVLPFIYVEAYKKKKPSILFGAAGICAGFIISFLTACAIDFNTLFYKFHKIMFDNNLWLFNPSTDPVINILPGEYFLMCGIIISATIILGIIVTFVLGIILKKRKKTKTATESTE